MADLAKAILGRFSPVFTIRIAPKSRPQVFKRYKPSASARLITKVWCPSIYAEVAVFRSCTFPLLLWAQPTSQQSPQIKKTPTKQQQNKTNKKQPVSSNPKQQSAPTEITIKGPVTVLNQPNSDQKERDAEQKAQTKFDNGVQIATLIFAALAAAGAVGAYFANRRQANASEGSLEHIKAEAIEQRKISLAALAKIKYVEVGFYEGIGIPGLPPLKVARVVENSPPYEQIIAAGFSWEQKATHQFLNHMKWYEALCVPYRGFSVHGIVVYFDMFGDQHYTRFGWRYYGPHLIGPKEVATMRREYEIPPEYNDGD